MSKILIERAVVEQALEALDKGLVVAPASFEHKALRAALENEFNPDWDRTEALQENLREHMAEIQRLRAALAEPQEPVPHAMQDAAVYGVGISRDGKRIDPASIYAQPEPVQEPVAWGLFAKVGRDFVLQHPVRFSEADAEDDRLMYPLDTVIVIRPLYTTSPQRKPLSEEEIYKAYEIALGKKLPNMGASRAELIEITRAVERAHGIK